MWPFKKKKDNQKQDPWWLYLTVQETMNDPRFDVEKLLDEITEHFAKNEWKEYGGIEYLAVVLLVERYKNKLSSYNRSASVSKTEGYGAGPYDSANPPYGQS
jgi:hypothetical protein